MIPPERWGQLGAIAAEFIKAIFSIAESQKQIVIALNGIEKSIGYVDDSIANSNRLEGKK